MNERLKRVYVCTAYSGDPIASRKRSLIYAAYLTKNNMCPVAPQLLLHQYVDEDTSRDVAMAHCIALLDGCDELHVVGYKVSQGMAEEITYASSQAIPVIFGHHYVWDTDLEIEEDVQYEMPLGPQPCKDACPMQELIDMP